MKRFKLRNLDIDRVDLVSRGANQHADIVIFKGLSMDDARARIAKDLHEDYPPVDTQLKNGPSPLERNKRKKKKDKKKGSAFPERMAAESSTSAGSAPVKKHQEHDLASPRDIATELRRAEKEKELFPKDVEKRFPSNKDKDKDKDKKNKPPFPIKSKGKPTDTSQAVPTGSPVPGKPGGPTSAPGQVTPQLPPSQTPTPGAPVGASPPEAEGPPGGRPLAPPELRPDGPGPALGPGTPGGKRPVETPKKKVGSAAELPDDSQLDSKKAAIATEMKRKKKPPSGIPFRQ